MRGWRLARMSAAAITMLAMVACGHSDEEMAAKQRDIDKLAAELRAARSLHDEDEHRYSTAQSEMTALRAQLDKAGLLDKQSKEEMDRLAKALSEYKVRAEQLEKMEARYRELRSRLEKLSQVGVKFVVRNNRMVIQLPGDILFDSGKDELKANGKAVLSQVAEVIRSDKDLYARNFQIAGHTDNAKYPKGGPFKDNWGLSLARARQVLLYLITPIAEGKGPEGGGLDAKRWAAAGYGETDPQAGTVENQTTEERERNRRVELVLQPNVDEMLNLSNIK